jgi:hypothetical protein
VTAASYTSEVAYNLQGRDRTVSKDEVDTYILCLTLSPGDKERVKKKVGDFDASLAGDLESEAG